MPMISQAFDQLNFSLSDIDLLVCDKGPGSFTGIRIGIATVKAFHDSLNIPCIGISSLEALAYLVKDDGIILSIMDCKNDNCYFALYELLNSKYTEIISPTADSFKNALKICYNYISNSSSVTIVGDGSKFCESIINENFKNNNFKFSNNNDLDSYCLALAGLNKFDKNKDEELLPLYLKKPQAQRQLEEKLKDINITNMSIDDLNSIFDKLSFDFNEFWNYNILKDELNCNNSKYIVAKLNNNVVGFAGLKIMVDEVDIMNVVVKKDLRNQGIGSLLLKNLINLAKELNASSISLEVMEENYPAIHLYQQFGFEKCGLRKNYYENKNGIIMKRTLHN